MQDLHLRLLRAERRFDARRGAAEVFVATVLERVVMDHRRSRGRRDRRFAVDRSLPLDSLADRHNDRDAVDRRLDVATILAGLPESLRIAADQLKFVSKGEAARNLGVSRNSLNTRVRDLRKAFERYRIRNS